jgi:hypothetical protein
MLQEYFWCANKNCTTHTKQPTLNIAQEVEGYKLCKDCYGRGYRLKNDVIVYRIENNKISK